MCNDYFDFSCLYDIMVIDSLLVFGRCVFRLPKDQDCHEMWCKRRRKGQKDLSRAADPHAAQAAPSAAPQGHALSGKGAVDVLRKGHHASGSSRSGSIDRRIISSVAASGANKGQGDVVGQSETSAPKQQDSRLDGISAALEKSFAVTDSGMPGASELPDDDLQRRISDIFRSLTGSQNLPSVPELVQLANGSSSISSASTSSNLAVLLELLKTQLLLTTMNPIPTEGSGSRPKSHPATKDKKR